MNRAVKVSVFASNAALLKVLAAPGEPFVRVASLVELLKSTCLVAAVLSKTRDWLDLYIWLRAHGFTIRDFRQAFAEAGIESQCDIALARLCSGIPQRDDEGYAHLLDQAPSLEQMKSFFLQQRDLLEVETAAEARRRRAD